MLTYLAQSSFGRDMFHQGVEKQGEGDQCRPSAGKATTSLPTASSFMNQRHMMLISISRKEGLGSGGKSGCKRAASFPSVRTCELEASPSAKPETPRVSWHAQRHGKQRRTIKLRHPDQPPTTPALRSCVVPIVRILEAIVKAPLQAPQARAHLRHNHVAGLRARTVRALSIPYSDTWIVLTAC